MESNSADTATPVPQGAGEGTLEQPIGQKGIRIGAEGYGIQREADRSKKNEGARKSESPRRMIDWCSKETLRYRPRNGGKSVIRNGIRGVWII